MKSPKDMDYNLGITVSKQVVKDHFADWGQYICEMYNMGDITIEDLSIRLRQLEKEEERLLRKLDEAKK